MQWYCFSFKYKKRNLWYFTTTYNAIASFRFWDENDYEYEIFSMLSIAHAWTSVILAGKRDSRCHSPTSFSENVIVAGTKLSNLRKFIILLSREGLTSFSINNPTSFFGEKKESEAFRGVFFWEHAQKVQVKSRTRTLSRPQI